MLQFLYKFCSRVFGSHMLVKREWNLQLRWKYKGFVAITNELMKASWGCQNYWWRPPEGCWDKVSAHQKKHQQLLWTWEVRMAASMLCSLQSYPSLMVYDIQHVKVLLMRKLIFKLPPTVEELSLECTLSTKIFYYHSYAQNDFILLMK